MITFSVWERTKTGAHCIARITGETISGPGAAMIERTLRAQGWPAGEDPDILLHGAYVFATRPRESDEGKR